MTKSQTKTKIKTKPITMKFLNHLTIKPFSHLKSAFLTITKGSAEISETREIGTPPIRETRGTKKL